MKATVQGIPAESRINEETRHKIRQEILKAGGREVSFLGLLDQNGMMVRVRLLARGDHSSVALPLKQVYLDNVPENPQEPEEDELAGRVLIHNHPSGVLSPSAADVQMSAGLAQEGMGSWIVDNEVEQIYVLTEAFLDQGFQPLDPEDLGRLLEPGGALDKLSKQFEARPAQVEMLKKVVEAFNDSGILACEAGTGIGKSFAYLIPALSWARQNRQRVVISTATINLQHQLLEKDIPMVQKTLDSDLKVVLAKGRNNYLCLNRLEDALEEDALFREEDDLLLRIRDWSRITSNGERSDLSFPVPEALWSRINSDPDSCSGLRCRSRDKCFLMKARREASQASVIVVNHHLFFADAAMRSQGIGYEATAVLPAFTRVIFDEAHSIDQAATSYFSRTLTKFSLHRYLNLLLRRRGNLSRGLIPNLRSTMGMDLTEAESLIDELRRSMADTETSIIGFLGERASLRLHPDGPIQSGQGPAGGAALQDAAPSDDTSDLRQELFGPLAALQTSILTLIDHLAQEIRALPEEDQERDLVQELRSMVRRLEGMAALCEDFRRYREDPGTVFWIERSRLPMSSPNAGESYISLCATPLDVASLMREQIFEPYESVVMTSATLTVQNSFDYYAARVGLSGVDTQTGLFPSPFDYASRVLLLVPTDVPEPGHPGYDDSLVPLVRDAILASGGRALVLFTAYTSLNRVFEAVRPALIDAGIPVKRQGDDDKSRLLRSFREEAASVLFATDSFWEGVDAPGNTLELLIICRLPFKVPSDPLLQARAEAIEARGGSSFFEMSVPDAIMKFKQGFGRLMRRSDDRGVVLVTDPRLIRKSYGSRFLKSLPETRKFIGESPDLIHRIRGFFDS